MTVKEMQKYYDDTPPKEKERILEITNEEYRALIRRKSFEYYLELYKDFF